MNTLLLTYVWPVNDLQLKLPGLVLLAEDDLAEELDRMDVVLTAEPTWTLHGDRLVMTAPVRRRNPWDVQPDDAAKAYVRDLMPEAA